jgi:hypothetical protein
VADFQVSRNPRSSRFYPQLQEGTNMAHTVEELLNMTDVQLDELFANATVDEIPSGEAKGTAIIANSTRFSDEIAEFVNYFAWQGKTFDPDEGVLRNRITHFGFNAIIARVYKAPSWLDQKECIVLDYSKTSLVVRWIRDEIRLISPNLYLGRVYWGEKPLIHFALEFTP